MEKHKEQKFRHELKYLVSAGEIQLIKNRIDHLVSLDSHVDHSGAYSIRSLYFDDYENRCFYENENGTDPREKFRIRIYNHSADRITLECKRKERGKTLKSSCPLTVEQTRMLMEGKPLPDIGQQHPVLQKLTMQSSVVLSLGMVGALSIVRFRTAIKDPMDLMFLFWSISVGIICGAGLAQVAVILSIVVTLGILILDQLPVAKAPMILVVNADNLDVETAVNAEVSQFDKHFRVKSRNMTASTLDLVVELRTSQGGDLVKKIM